jgi:site-specific recombinase XerD
MGRLQTSGIKASSAQIKLAAVKSFCRWADAEGLTDAGLIQSICGPRRRYLLPDVPNQAEVKKLLEANPDREP